MQTELGVDACTHHRDDQPARMAQNGFVSDHDGQDHGEQNEGRIALMGEHLVDRRHDDERRQDRENAEGHRSDADIAQRALLDHYEPRQPAQVERLVRLADTAIRAEHQCIAGPDLTQPKFVHGHRRFRRPGARVLQEDDLLVLVHPGQQAGTSVGEQQHHRPGVLETHQVPPAQPHRARPHPGILGPLRQRSGCRLRLAAAQPEFVGVKFRSVEPRGEDNRQKPLVDRAATVRTGRVADAGGAPAARAVRRSVYQGLLSRAV
jgi:hypothetical protein